VNPDDVDGGIRASIIDGAKEGCYNPSQYTSGRVREHLRLSPGIHCEPRIPKPTFDGQGHSSTGSCRICRSLLLDSEQPVCAGFAFFGSLWPELMTVMLAGTIAGVGTYLKSVNPRIVNVGYDFYQRYGPRSTQIQSFYGPG
jgi:hypothetical protein